MSVSLISKIRNGTRSDSTDLCPSCVSCTVRKGGRDSDEVRYCSDFRTNLTERVSECSGYLNKNLTSIQNMKETAWILSTNKKREIGFTPYKKWREDNDDREEYEY